MRLLRSAALAALCAVALVVPAGALTGAQRAPVNAFSAATARIVFGNGGHCTGALVHPEWLLTARHCVEQTFVQRIGFGMTGLEEERTAAEVLHNAADDITLIRLSEPVPMDPLELSLDTSEVAPGDVAEIYGWGVAAEGLDYLTYGTRRVQVHGGAYDPRDPSRIPSDDGRTYANDVDTARTTPGDSGSPVLVHDKLVSIHIRSWNAPEEDDFYSASVTLARHADWLLRTVPDLAERQAAAELAEQTVDGVLDTGSIDLSSIVDGSVAGALASNGGA